MSVKSADTAEPSCSEERFVVESCPFGSGDKMSFTRIRIDEGKLLDWPMVYILSNDGEAYVGQTTSVIRRMTQHGANEAKQIFDTANIIYNDEANMSVVTDYESRLIQLMHADGRFTLTNKNGGLSNADYYAKAEYDSMFTELWDKLRSMDLALHSIEEIEDSEVFKFSPFKSLNTDQHMALREIMSEIEGFFSSGAQGNISVSDDRSTRPLVVEGVPGTGKTVLAIFLLKALKDDPSFNNLNIRIVEPVTALRETLQRSLGGVQNLSSDDIIAPIDVAKAKYTGGETEHPFDILLVDEAHRLKRRKNIIEYLSFDNTTEALGFERGGDATQLDWIIRQAKMPIFFYDPLQTIGPSGIDEAIMRDRLGEDFEYPIRLSSQMRVRGGTAYLDYLADILWERNPERTSFSGYDLHLHESFADFHQAFEQCLSKHQLTRMIAGYAWKWATNPKKRTDTFDIDIDGIKICWNRVKENWVGLGLEKPEVAHEMGCIHSIQGFDLSYAFVVIGPDLRYDERLHRITVDRSHYFDTKGRNCTTDEQLEEYIKHIYYVLLTRGMFGTHVYVCDEPLRRHLAQFIPD